MNRWLKWMAVLLLFSAAYRNRYRVLNTVFGYGPARKLAVTAAMRIPGLRSRVMGQVFQ
ncbi:hypothetical protein QQ991_11910 [Weizmannia coagulans]|uniref:Uncharacterized protein n=2 Tax=Heyndrickxia TaxID=2837504 RepID=A0AAN0WBQ1_HEYCO|nr:MULTISPECIES: hypothetical protein [Heyndrickxia]NWN93445.1 hypothetical protein [Bacillus sp. (in: firmicutes)]AJO22601.1 hypothetical protein SB48_HM08orf02858 [Heyndrickxia coagulans]AKN55874.1 hypothetical protein AB434_3469 [Heyndrickxia coagulans]MBT2193943.1 hypothetical protein [Heyndrickxia coagulans]MBT2235962.1 hypothetical protein [Heyndrickxia coagulans]